MTDEKLFAQIYAVVAQIPVGRVATYGQVALWVGKPRGARTVGWALHSLPENQKIPWHRVVNARGELSSPDDPSGINVQRMLLESEGVLFDSRGRIDLRQYGWKGPDA